MNHGEHGPDLRAVKWKKVRGTDIRHADCTCGDRDHHWIDTGSPGKPEWVKVTVMS